MCKIESIEKNNLAIIILFAIGSDAGSRIYLSFTIRFVKHSIQNNDYNNLYFEENDYVINCKYCFERKP